MDSDEYGFFCDLENVKTMEYDKVEYYVVKVSKKYEVRRKPVSKIVDVVVSEPQPEQPSCCWTRISETECVDIHAKSIQTQPKSLSCLHSAFTYLLRLPSDVYYSFMVCTVTASSVYLVMTFSDNSN